MLAGEARNRSAVRSCIFCKGGGGRGRTYRQIDRQDRARFYSGCSGTFSVRLTRDLVLC